MQSIQTPNLTIRYRQAGSGSQALVFVHGNYASSRWWLPQLERLPPNVQAFAPDLRGCGSPQGITLPNKEDHNQISIEDLSDDLAEFISALKIEDPIVVGHSLGGIVATDYALRYPDSVRGMLLENTGPPDGVPGGFLGQAVLLPLEFGSQILMRNTLRLAGIPRRGDLARDLVQDALAASPGQYIAFTGAVSRWNVESELPNLDLPVLLVWGGKDRIMPSRISQIYLSKLPEAKLVIVPDTGHSPHIERPNAFAGVLEQFVDRCVSSGRSEYQDVPPISLKDKLIRKISILFTGSF